MSPIRIDQSSAANSEFQKAVTPAQRSTARDSLRYFHLHLHLQQPRLHRPTHREPLATTKSSS
jgi:hypothetical protein